MCSSDLGPVWLALERAAPGVVTVMLSARTGEGVDELLRYLPAGTTAACVGSSGVGKSTLINRLLGHDAQATGAIREHDGRGRHTTTHRELLALSNGAWIIDTPGLRELVPWFDGGEQAPGFADIAALASSCRFRNCGHTDEPGCAVLAAVASGELDEARLANFRRLQREAAFQASRRDDAAARERKRVERQFGKAIRDIEKHNPKRR